MRMARMAKASSKFAIAMPYRGAFGRMPPTVEAALKSNADETTLKQMPAMPTAKMTFMSFIFG